VDGRSGIGYTDRYIGRSTAKATPQAARRQDVRGMCKKDDEALRLLREVVTDGDGNPSGANQHSDGDGGSVDNINRSSGTSKDYTLDRLAREDPELYEKVVAEEMNRLRSTVKDLLNPEADTVGRPQKDGDNVRNTNKSSTDDDSYALRRLKRGAHGLTL